MADLGPKGSELSSNVYDSRFSPCSACLHPARLASTLAPLRWLFPRACGACLVQLRTLDDRGGGDACRGLRRQRVSLPASGPRRPRWCCFHERVDRVRSSVHGRARVHGRLLAHDRPGESRGVLYPATPVGEPRCQPVHPRVQWEFRLAALPRTPVRNADRLSVQRVDSCSHRVLRYESRGVRRIRRADARHRRAQARSGSGVGGRDGQL